MSKRKRQYPSKVTVNLVMRDHPMNSLHAVLPVFLVLFVVIGLFAKFAVMDRLSEASAARASLAAAETRLAEAEAANADFASVSDEYSRYFYSSFTEAEIAAVDRMEILGLLEEGLMSAVRVSAVSLKGNTMTVSVSGITLQGLSDLMRALKARELVSDVSVYTAGTKPEQTKGSSLAEVTMTITLVQGEKGGDGR